MLAFPPPPNQVVLLFQDGPACVVLCNCTSISSGVSATD